MIRLGTIFEKMSFDKDVLAVRAGKPVEFVLENTDLMPHNFVIVQPGTLGRDRPPRRSQRPGPEICRPAVRAALGQSARRQPPAPAARIAAPALDWNPLLIVGAAFVAGIVIAKVIDWRGHAHPRD